MVFKFACLDLCWSSDLVGSKQHVFRYYTNMTRIAYDNVGFILTLQI
jgi:hypothetical protein